MSNCSTCQYNINNCCTNFDGYYLYKEVIIEEQVPCDEWLAKEYDNSSY